MQRWIGTMLVIVVYCQNSVHCRNGFYGWNATDSSFFKVMDNQKLIMIDKTQS